MTSSLRYRALPPYHLRILRVTSYAFGNHHRTFHCRLEDFHIDRLPHSIALSYAWPPAKSPKTLINCSSGTLLLSEHIHAALSNLSSPGAACSFRIWIDAICINQDDESEKSIQVPLMGYIYGRAGLVIAWLGQNEEVDMHKTEVDGLMQRIALITPRPLQNEDLTRPLVDSNLPEKGHHLWNVLLTIFHSQWFCRFWIVQEVALAKTLQFLCGHCFLPWKSISNLRKTHFWEMVDGQRPSLMAFESTRALIECREQVNETVRSGKRVYSTEMLLDELRAQQVSKPIDRIYGAMFLFDKAVRDLVTVHYTYENRYHQVYIQVGRLLLLRDSRLNTLRYAQSKYRPWKLPSWCPNWDSVMSVRDVVDLEGPSGYSAGSSSLAVFKHSVRLPANTDAIEVFGHKIDRVQRVIHLGPPGGTSMQKGFQDTSMRLLWLLGQWKGIELLKKMPGSDVFHEKIHFRNLVMNKWNSGGYHHGIREDEWPEALRAYHEAVSYLGDLHGPQDKDAKMTASVHMFMNMAGFDLARPYVFTEQGRVGRGPADIRLGDNFVVLHGARALFILRYHAHRKTAQLIGDAYLDGCMNGDKMPSEGRGPDEYLTIG